MKKDWKNIFMAVFLAAAFLPVRVHAESGDGFRLDQSGRVELTSSHAAKEGVSSMSFCLTVDAPEGSQVAFEFDDSSAKILEYRYNKDEKKLNIYLAGRDALFAEGADSLPVGRVLVLDQSGGSAAATVGVVPDSLAFVYGSELKIMEGIEIPEAVQIGQANPDSKPTNTPVPVVPQEPTAPPGTTAAPDATVTPEPIAPKPSGEEGTARAQRTFRNRAARRRAALPPPGIPVQRSPWFPPKEL